MKMAVCWFYVQAFHFAPAVIMTVIGNTTDNHPVIGHSRIDAPVRRYIALFQMGQLIRQILKAQIHVQRIGIFHNQLL